MAKSKSAKKKTAPKKTASKPAKKSSVKKPVKKAAKKAVKKATAKKTAPKKTAPKKAAKKSAVKKSVKKAGVKKSVKKQAKVLATRPVTKKSAAKKATKKAGPKSTTKQAPKKSIAAGPSKPQAKTTFRKEKPKPTSPSAEKPGKKLVRDEYRSDKIPGKKPKDPLADSTATVDSSHESVGETDRPVQTGGDLGPARQAFEGDDVDPGNRKKYAKTRTAEAVGEDDYNDSDYFEKDGDDQPGKAVSSASDEKEEYEPVDPASREQGHHDDNTASGAAAFSKFIPKGNMEQKLRANSKPKGGPKPTGKKPLWN